jgi:uncharacterized protein YdiU (UPF0061 family)
MSLDEPNNYMTNTLITSIDELAKLANYSLVDTLNCDPDATSNGFDHISRQVFSGHFVPVRPTPLKDPEYVLHSKNLFHELGFTDQMAQSTDFVRVFSGDLSQVPKQMRKLGWACGYALSIYGTEYYHQCPFQTGNGYGDGRAISVIEALINGRRWEMQLKGGGSTPYCRGGDGRAVLRSSVREFLAQEHMHALGVPTSRSLSLYVSKTETVNRPWYSLNSVSYNPDIYVTEPVAITTRVASSFIRVGQLELFARRARKNEHPKAVDELEKIVQHLIAREYTEDIDKNLPTHEKIISLARAFLDRLTSLVTNWIRVGYCQGNFNSDNCAAGGFTLDYGPFGFCDAFHPSYQPWTGGGLHYSFMNQPLAAERNFQMFCLALRPLLLTQAKYMEQLEEIRDSFMRVMQLKLEKMWASKLGMVTFDADLFRELEMLMVQTPVDYTIFFRELSKIPDDITLIQKSFYRQEGLQDLQERWKIWLVNWRSVVDVSKKMSDQMKRVNPKYTLREWLLVPAYREAAAGNYALVRELNEVMTRPYEEQSQEVEDKFYKVKPIELFKVGGVSHLSCSS